jgi:hypothetical protein
LPSLEIFAVAPRNQARVLGPLLIHQLLISGQRSEGCPGCSPEEPRNLPLLCGLLFNITLRIQNPDTAFMFGVLFDTT